MANPIFQLPSKTIYICIVSWKRPIPFAKYSLKLQCAITNAAWHGGANLFSVIDSNIWVRIHTLAPTAKAPHHQAAPKAQWPPAGTVEGLWDAQPAAPTKLLEPPSSPAKRQLTSVLPLKGGDLPYRCSTQHCLGPLWVTRAPQVLKACLWSPCLLKSQLLQEWSGPGLMHWSWKPGIDIMYIYIYTYWWY